LADPEGGLDGNLPYWGGSGGSGLGRGGGGGGDEADGQDFGLEAASAAGVAGLGVHEAFEAVAGEFAFALGVKAFEIGDDALEGALDFAGAAGAPKGELDILGAGAAEELLFEILRQILPGRLQALAELRPCRAGGSCNKPSSVCRRAARAAPPLFQRFFRVRHDQALVEDHFLPQP
jgi:hypothetical protein